jgi:hypothetical protein
MDVSANVCSRGARAASYFFNKQKTVDRIEKVCYTIIVPRDKKKIKKEVKIMTTVTMKDNVLTLARPTSFEIDIEDFAVCVEERGLLEALTDYTNDDSADDFYEDHRNELLVMVARCWIEQYDSKRKD